METISIFVPFYQYKEFYQSNDFAEAFIIERIIEYVHKYNIDHDSSSLSIDESIYLQIQDSAIDSEECENLINEYECLSVPLFVNQGLNQLFNSKKFIEEINTLLLVKGYDIFNITPALNDGMEITLGVCKSVLEVRMESI
jgi:hypothetical protein